MVKNRHIFAALSVLTSLSTNALDLDNAIFSHYADNVFYDLHSTYDHHTVIFENASEDKVTVKAYLFGYRAWDAEFEEQCSLKGSVVECPENSFKYEFSDDNTVKASFIGEPESDIASQVLSDLNNLKRESLKEFRLNNLYSKKAWFFAVKKAMNNIADILRPEFSKSDVNDKYIKMFDELRDKKCGVLDDNDNLSTQIEKYSCHYEMIYEQYYTLGESVANEESWSELRCSAGDPIPGYVYEYLNSPGFKTEPSNLD